jgi:hypothetical protein
MHGRVNYLPQDQEAEEEKEEARFPQSALGQATNDLQTFQQVPPCTGSTTPPIAPPRGTSL